MTSRDVSRFALSCVASLSLASCGANVGTPLQASNVVPSASGRYPNVLLAFTGNRAKRGIVPDAPVIFDAAGAIYGTTVYDGIHRCYSGQGTCGTVFKLTPAGSGYWGETVLYAFCRKTKCRDGANPRAGLIFDSQGSLYGTTSLGGSANGGTVFKLTPSKSGYSEACCTAFAKLQTVATANLRQPESSSIRTARFMGRRTREGFRAVLIQRVVERSSS
jgi:uncharacterized repeat protein (TIGR03803 family)